MTNNNSKRKSNKPKIIHSHLGYTENDKLTKEYQLIRKTADRIFNSPSLTKQSPTRKKTKK